MRRPGGRPRARGRDRRTAPGARRPLRAARGSGELALDRGGRLRRRHRGDLPQPRPLLRLLDRHDRRHRKHAHEVRGHPSRDGDEAGKPSRREAHPARRRVPARSRLFRRGGSRRRAIGAGRLPPHRVGRRPARALHAFSVSRRELRFRKGAELRLHLEGEELPRQRGEPLSVGDPAAGKRAGRGVLVEQPVVRREARPARRRRRGVPQNGRARRRE